MLFREIILVYSENNTKPLNTLCGEMQIYWLLKQVVYSYHWALKSQQRYIPPNYYKFVY
jgi:hypothetical protein